MENDANFNKPCRQNYYNSYSLFHVLSQSSNQIPVELLHSARLQTLWTGSTVQWRSVPLLSTSNARTGSGTQRKGLCGAGSCTNVLPPPPLPTPQIKLATLHLSENKQFLSIPTNFAS